MEQQYFDGKIVSAGRFDDYDVWDYQDNDRLIAVAVLSAKSSFGLTQVCNIYVLRGLHEQPSIADAGNAKTYPSV